MPNDIKNNLLGIQEEAPFMEADSVTDEEERERQRVARKRLFWFLVGIGVILTACVIWEFVEILLNV